MPPRNRGLPPAGRRGLFRSFQDAFRGVWRCLKSERNMRIHAAACGYVLFFAVKSGVHGGELACLLLAMGAVTAAEAMNTSVEKLCDFVEDKRNPKIAAVKDMAAGAVVLSALFAALAGGAVLLRPELWQTVREIAGTPWELGAFGASLAACALLIFAVPRRGG